MRNVRASSQEIIPAIFIVHVSGDGSLCHTGDDSKLETQLQQMCMDRLTVYPCDS